MMMTDVDGSGEVLGFEGVVQTSGFLVPSKTRGKLQFYDMSAAVPNTTTINSTINIASADVGLEMSKSNKKQFAN